VIKAGLMYGLGVGKSVLAEAGGAAPERKIRRSMFDPTVTTPRRSAQVCIFNDPWFEDVDVFDFAWDPFGATCSRAAGSRTGCGSARLVPEPHPVGRVGAEGAKALDEDELRKLGGGSGRSTTSRGRRGWRRRGSRRFVPVDARRGDPRGHRVA
jgi:hypothetical protein